MLSILEARRFALFFYRNVWRLLPGSRILTATPCRTEQSVGVHGDEA